MSKIPCLELSGDAFDRGIEHGESFKDEIRTNVKFYRGYFREKEVKDSEVRSYAENAISLVEEEQPRFVKEMEGVAEGSDSSLEEIAFINFRHTIVYSAYADECTGFAVPPEASEDGTYLGQNWDWKPEVEKLVIKNRRQENPDFLALTEAGNVGGKFGLNGNGIGFTVNGLNTPSDGENLDRLPSHVRGRNILESERLDQAIRAVIETPRPASRNYILGRETGEIVDIETTPEMHYFLYPGNGFLTHSGHFETPGPESILETKVPSSVTRKARIERLFSRTEKPYTLEDLKNFLQDHVGKPKSICRHPEGSSSVTKASVILDLEEKSMIAADGPPCKNEYEVYRL